MRYLINFLLLLLSFQSSAQNRWEWMRGARNGQSHGSKIVSDRNGNVYAAGLCWYNGRFDSLSFSVAGISSMPLVKYDSAGNIQWMLLADSSAPTGMVVDAQNNTYILGLFYGRNVTFGNCTLNNPNDSTSILANASIFLTKVTSDGNVIWMRTIGDINGRSSSDYQTGNHLALDGCGNLYVACSFINSPHLDGFSFTNKSEGVVPSTDILIAKFDSSGSLVFAKQFGGNAVDWVNGIGVTSAQQVYVVGEFNSSVLPFGNTILTDTLHTILGWNSFVTLLDASGDPIWAKTTSNSVSSEAFCLAVDNDDNLYVAGDYGGGERGPVSLSIGSVTFKSVPPLTTYGWIAKFNTYGNALWGSTIQERLVISRGIAVSPCNHVWLLGSNLYQGTNATIIDTVDGNYISAPPINKNPIFVMEWDKNGAYNSASVLPAGDEGSWAECITSDPWGNIYIAADAQIQPFVVAGDSLYNTSSGSVVNMYVAKLNTHSDCGVAIPKSCEVNNDGSCALDVFMPNTFTPNSDGNNDVFYPRSETVTQAKSLEVYNRWGEVIFEKRNFEFNNPNFGWNGEIKGGMASPDIYVYVLVVVCRNGKEEIVKGDIALVK